MLKAVCKINVGPILELRAAFTIRHRFRRVLAIRDLHTDVVQAEQIPFRKQLKDKARKQRQDRSLGHESTTRNKTAVVDADFRLSQWRLTVGLEIHAQLNTEYKLFSTAESTSNDLPNTNVALFDLAFPGSQPCLQEATLIPAVRAALALNCHIQQISHFDRKHYYYQDQPAGYQITQYYDPFATRGHIVVQDHDGIASQDGQCVKVGIQQVQLEQDTAKSNLQPPSTALLDFNRVGHPLIEIITLPQIHHPQTAAACVRKIQAILQTTNTVTTGMELGGMRVDVNVSVSPTGSDSLGQRTEIKNLNSIKAVEDAIIAERDRQISVLSSGGKVDGETRGWTLGSTETKKLRGKEGEVDYRYMPDPDVQPLIISEDLIARISQQLPTLPDQIVTSLVDESGLSVKDAKTLVSLDGQRLDYFDEVISQCTEGEDRFSTSSRELGKFVGNWVLHELGGLFNSVNIPFSQDLVPTESMARLLRNLQQGRITGATAKRLLALVFDGDRRPVDQIIKEENLGLRPMLQDEYTRMATTIIDENRDKVKQIQQKKQLGKLQFLIGQMMRRGEGKVEAVKAEAVLKELLGLP